MRQYNDVFDICCFWTFGTTRGEWHVFKMGKGPACDGDVHGALVAMSIVCCDAQNMILLARGDFCNSRERLPA